MYRQMVTTALLAAAAFALPAAGANTEEFHASLSGFKEVPSAILSEGMGSLSLDLNQATQTIKFTLSFSRLSAPATQAHIHFGKVHTAGAVVVFFCSNLQGAPPGVQACPAGGGTVSGTLTAANVLAVPGQHISAGDFDALTDALTSNTAYANIHTTSFPGGEIRGQIRAEGDDED